MSDKPIRCPHCTSTNVSRYDSEDYIYATCFECNKRFDRSQEARDLFLLLWDRSVTSKYYYKEIWQRLQVLLRF